MIHTFVAAADVLPNSNSSVAIRKSTAAVVVVNLEGSAVDDILALSGLRNDQDRAVDN